MLITCFRDLEAWRQGIELVEECYKATRPFPSHEMYGLTSQMRRAAVSIPSNVAEGHARKTTAVYANHVSIALGSEAELETCIVVAQRLGYLSNDDASALVARCHTVGKILSGLFTSLERKMLAAQNSHVSRPIRYAKPKTEP